MSFGNLHIHVSGASRSEAGRPDAGRRQPSLPAAGLATTELGHERRRSLAPPSAGGISSAAAQTSPAREPAVAYRGRSQTDLSVVTAEGDRITISLAAQVKYAASSRTSPDGSSQTVETASSSQLRVAVQGDLSEAELKDLGTLLDKLSQATTGASSTDAATAGSADPAGFAGLTSLAAFRYRSQQTVEASSLVDLRG